MLTRNEWIAFGVFWILTLQTLSVILIDKYLGNSYGLIFLAGSILINRWCFKFLINGGVEGAVSSAKKSHDDLI